MRSHESVLGQDVRTLFDLRSVHGRLRAWHFDQPQHPRPQYHVDHHRWRCLRYCCDPCGKFLHHHPDSAVSSLRQAQQEPRQRIAARACLEMALGHFNLHRRLSWHHLLPWNSATLLVTSAIRGHHVPVGHIFDVGVVLHYLFHPRALSPLVMDLLGLCMDRETLLITLDSESAVTKSPPSSPRGTGKTRSEFGLSGMSRFGSSEQIKSTPTPHSSFGV